MKRKIIVWLFILFLIFALGSAFSLAYIRESTSELSRLIKLHQIENLRRSLVLNVQIVQSDLYTVHTHFSRNLNAIVTHVRNLEETAGTCRTCHHSPEQTEKLEEVMNLITEYQSLLSYYITASADADRIQNLADKAATIGNELFVHAEEMSINASSTLGEMTRKAVEKINNVRVILYATLAAAFVLGMVVSAKLIQSITRPVKELLNATRVIASGTFGHKISYEDETEFGELAHKFNMMSETIESGYEQLRIINEELENEIAERKRAEDRMKASLEEKEVLLQEIHHRVKNNMQIISSLLKIQSAFVEDENALKLFEDSQSRIRTMALIHEKLYMSENLSSIDFCDYIRNLLRNITLSFGQDARNIELICDCDDISLNADIAVPCGLIINELVSNAFRHAFPTGRNGEIRISLTRTNSEELLLIVSDDGIGLPDGIDLEVINSLGLDLVYTLAEHQLQGKVDLDTSAGTRFSIRFKEPEYKQRI